MSWSNKIHGAFEYAKNMYQRGRSTVMSYIFNKYGKDVKFEDLSAEDKKKISDFAAMLAEQREIFEGYNKFSSETSMFMIKNSGFFESLRSRQEALLDGNNHDNYSRAIQDQYTQKTFSGIQKEKVAAHERAHEKTLRDFEVVRHYEIRSQHEERMRERMVSRARYEQVMLNKEWERRYVEQDLRDFETRDARLQEHVQSEVRLEFNSDLIQRNNGAPAMAEMVSVAPLEHVAGLLMDRAPEAGAQLGANKDNMAWLLNTDVVTASEHLKLRG